MNKQAMQEASELYGIYNQWTYTSREQAEEGAFTVDMRPVAGGAALVFKRSTPRSYYHPDHPECDASGYLWTNPGYPDPKIEPRPKPPKSNMRMFIVGENGELEEVKGADWKPQPKKAGEN